MTNKVLRQRLKEAIEKANYQPQNCIVCEEKEEAINDLQQMV
jgi:hypothetical protein